MLKPRIVRMIAINPAPALHSIMEKRMDAVR